MRQLTFSVLFISLLLPLSVFAQEAPFLLQTPPASAADLALQLKKAQNLGTVMYIAAHPDDENNSLITWLARDKGYRTIYLSLTRGDGGQNLIGPEVREHLGVIRSQELLAARRTDGGEQWFTRANDFGFSKHPDETLQVWDSVQVLADVVRAVRKFKPDVLITRFSPERDSKTHGHHTASAILAQRAFSIAADPTAFPEQLEELELWQPKRIFWNTSSWFFRRNPDMMDKLEKFEIEIGGYSALRGESLGEIASRSRSMHQSQAFGTALQRGTTTEWFVPLDGKGMPNSLLEGINISWSRLNDPKAVQIGDLLSRAEKELNFRQPHLVLPHLFKAYELSQQLPVKNSWVQQKQKEITQLILSASGFWADATTANAILVPNDSARIQLRAIARSLTNITLQSVEVAGKLIQTDSVLTENKLLNIDYTFQVPALPASQPYWLQLPPDIGMYKVADKSLIGKPQNPAPITATYTLYFPAHKQSVKFVLPLEQRYTDYTTGEHYRPVEIVPPITLHPNKDQLIFADGSPRNVIVTVASHTENIGQVLIEPKLPEGWRSEPPFVNLQFEENNKELHMEFRIYPPAVTTMGELVFQAKTADSIYTKNLERITYQHIPTQTLLPEATTKLVRVSVSKLGNEIGYLPGAGDQIPEALKQLGYEVTFLNDENISQAQLAAFDAVVVGIRAYNTYNRMPFIQEALLDYVEKGGHVVVQYNTTYGLRTEDFGPFPLELSRDRVTVEQAEVRMLEENHLLFSAPNQISNIDFDNWVQERGLYFPDKWDNNYTPLLQMNDPGEEAKKGALLVAHYGRGSFIYTGLSFFRQLPAGVPGAYRLFSNLVSYGEARKNQ